MFQKLTKAIFPDNTKKTKKRRKSSLKGKKRKSRGKKSASKTKSVSKSKKKATKAKSTTKKSKKKPAAKRRLNINDYFKKPDKIPAKKTKKRQKRSIGKATLISYWATQGIDISDKVGMPKSVPKKGTKKTTGLLTGSNFLGFEPIKKPNTSNANDEDMIPSDQENAAALAKLEEASKLIETRRLLNEFHNGIYTKMDKLGIDDLSEGEAMVAFSVTEIVDSWRGIELNSLDPRYMDKQSDLKPRMRTILFGWIVELCQKFRLRDETLWRATAICDRYCTEFQDLNRNKYQLLGAACLWIATKYQEIYPPLARDFVFISDNVFTERSLREMEWKVTWRLDFNFGGPNAHTFASRFIKVAARMMPKKGKIPDRFMHLVYYCLERCMLEYHFLQYKPSLLAATGIYTALKCLGMKWEDCLAEETKYSLDDLRDHHLDKKMMHMILDFNNKRHAAVIKKYADDSRGGVSTLRPRGNGK